jgi:hypothetical protein
VIAAYLGLMDAIPLGLFFGAGNPFQKKQAGLDDRPEQ